MTNSFFPYLETDLGDFMKFKMTLVWNTTAETWFIYADSYREQATCPLLQINLTDALFGTVLGLTKEMHLPLRLATRR